MGWRSPRPGGRRPGRGAGARHRVPHRVRRGAARDRRGPRVAFARRGGAGSRWCSACSGSWPRRSLSWPTASRCGRTKSTRWPACSAPCSATPSATGRTTPAPPRPTTATATATATTTMPRRLWPTTRARRRRGGAPLTLTLDFELEDDDEDEDEDEPERTVPTTPTRRGDDADENGDGPELAEPIHDPGAVRRYRFKHPTASGKTVAAAGFVDAANITGVLILTHRRLLVEQFKRDLTTHGYGGRIREAILDGKRGPTMPPVTDRDLRLVHPQRRAAEPRRLRRRALRRGAHGARREDRRRHPRARHADVHRHDRDRPAAAEARRRRVPGRGRRLPAGRCRPRRRGRAVARRARAAWRLAGTRARSSAATSTSRSSPRHSTTTR